VREGGLEAMRKAMGIVRKRGEPGPLKSPAKVIVTMRRRPEFARSFGATNFLVKRTFANSQRRHHHPVTALPFSLVERDVGLFE
jgi:hypothetical protein